jgi:hypothetical protein
VKEFSLFPITVFRILLSIEPVDTNLLTYRPEGFPVRGAEEELVVAEEYEDLL